MISANNRTPAVCSALDAAVFATLVNATHISRSGPKFSTTARWVIELTPQKRSRYAAALLALVGALPDDRPPSPAAPRARVAAAEFLDEQRRAVIRLVRALGVSGEERLHLGEQVKRLVEAKRIR